MRTFLTTVITAALVFGAPASMAMGADTEQRPDLGQSMPGPRVVMQHHASTLEEGVLRGSGALARGIGEAQYLRSLAAINREYARRLYIENRQQAVETYFSLKRLNRDARAELALRHPTSQDLVRYAKVRLPDVLSQQQYDRENGKVNWPMVLLSNRFAHDRGRIDELVAERASSQPIAAEIDSEIAAVTKAMLDTLRVNGADLNSTDFIAAMKFIKSLNYAARANPTLSSQYGGNYYAGGARPVTGTSG